MLGNDFDRSAKDSDLRIGTNVALYADRDDSSEILRSVWASGAGVTNPDERRCHLHDADMNRRPEADLSIIRAVAIYKDSIPIPYPYESCCTSMAEVSKTWGEMSKYGFYDCNYQFMKAIGNKSTDFSLKKISEKNRSEYKEKSKYDMEIVILLVSVRSNAICYEKVTAVKVCIFNLNDHHQMDSYVRIYQSKDRKILLRSVSLIHVTSFRASIRV